MPECIGENVPVIFTCVCCKAKVEIWAYTAVHPISSNTELVPEQYRGRYRQHWYLSPDNEIFDRGRLLRYEQIDAHWHLSAVSLTIDGNPYINDLPFIPEEGIGPDRVLWICEACNLISLTVDPLYLFQALPQPAGS